MAARLIALKTAVPGTVLPQTDVREVFAAQPGLSRLAQRLIATSFNESGIDTRHTVIDELTLERRADDPHWFDRDSMILHSPGTRERNELYTAAGGQLFVETARAALDGCRGIRRTDVTHVITVSCTGFFAPGPDFLVARELGLAPGVQRYHLGFMGCYAAMPALRLAAQLCESDPAAVVLVVVVELCTLHVRSSNEPDLIIAASLFSDGAAAAIVTARTDLGDGPALTLDAFDSVVTPTGEDAMAWTIGDEGFTMVLSSYVPHIIGDHIEGAVAPLLAAARLDAAAIPWWAVHPGGRSIVDRIEQRLELRPEQVAPSRETLRDFGNMSAVTVLFVLKRVLEQAAQGDRVFAIAFGPGLTVESALMTVS